MQVKREKRGTPGTVKAKKKKRNSAKTPGEKNGSEAGRVTPITRSRGARK